MSGALWPNVPNMQNPNAEAKQQMRPRRCTSCCKVHPLPPKAGFRIQGVSFQYPDSYWCADLSGRIGGLD